MATRSDTTADFLLEDLKTWLGRNAFDRNLREIYLAVFEKITTADWGRFTDDSGDYSLAWKRFLAVVDSYATYMLRDHLENTPHSPVIFWRNETDQAGLISAEMIDRISPNTATFEELVHLPWIGPATAELILTHRQQAAPYRTIEDLLSIPGVSPETINRVERYLRFDSNNISARIPGLSRRRSVSFMEYIDILVTHRMATTPLNGFSSDSRERLAASELLKAADLAQRHPYWQMERPASRTDTQLMYNWKDQDVGELSVFMDAVTAGPLRNAEILEVAHQLISSSARKIYLNLFILRVHAGSFIESLIDEISRAFRRGVDVRVILDRNNESNGEPGSESDGFADLVDRGIPVRTDLPEIPSHSKCMIVDDETIIIGTHNWSSSSMYRMQELSLLIHSSQLVRSESQRFEWLWDAYHPDTVQRKIAIDLLRYLSPAERRALQVSGVSTIQEVLSIPEDTHIPSIEIDRLHRLQKIVMLMQELKVTEALANALVTIGIKSQTAYWEADHEQLAQRISQLTLASGEFVLSPLQLPRVAS